MCDIKYELLGSFVFENSDNISKAEYAIYRHGSDKMHIIIDRKIRRRPLVGMKQPIPHGAIMGWDAEIEIKRNGRVADGHNLKLFKDDKLIQETRTDEYGKASLDIEFGINSYKLEIYREAEDCNIDPGV